MRSYFQSLAMYTAVFFTGAFAYGLFELAGRGRTHITMGLLGGAAMCMIHRLDCRRGGALALLGKLIFSAACITAAELAAGVVLNLKLGLGIWDYSNMPYNFLGQICPAFSMIWFSLSGVGCMLDLAVRRVLTGKRPDIAKKPLLEKGIV